MVHVDSTGATKCGVTPLVVAVGAVGITETLCSFGDRTWRHEDEVGGQMFGQPWYSLSFIGSEYVQHQLVDSFRERSELVMSEHEGSFADTWPWVRARRRSIIRTVPVGDQAVLAALRPVDRVSVAGPRASSTQR
jgi:hypothetical protein